MVRAESVDTVTGGHVTVRIEEETEGVHRGGRVPTAQGSPIDLGNEREGVHVVGDCESKDFHVRVQPGPRCLVREGGGRPVRYVSVD